MILVTGAAGFIGSHTLVSLLRDGVEAVGVDQITFEQMNVRAVQAAGGQVQQLLLRDVLPMNHLLRALKPHTVIHMAAKVGVRDSLQDPRGYLETNVTGTLNLLDACVKAGVKTVILASTSSVYGNVDVQVETAVPEPRSPYAASKLGMEALGRVYHALHGLNVIMLRFFSVYGERMRRDLMLHQMIESAALGTRFTLYDSGDFWRDWTHVDDVVQGVRAATALTGCEVINLGRGVPVRLRTVLEQIEAVSGRQTLYRNDFAPRTEPRITCADIHKAERLLGYAPQVSIEAGLLRTWQWYLAENEVSLA